jgi:GNAT superfamily N-acetyltransferase
MGLTVRPARPSDKPRVLEICRKTWKGWDYVPLFFDRWVRERGFWIGEFRSRVVGFGKATKLSKEEWWLEGLRMDPKFRSRGFGTKLSFRILHEAFRVRPAFLRLATADVNSESIRIIEKMGFRRFFTTKYYVGEDIRTEFGPVPRLTRPGARQAYDFLVRSEELAASHGILGWTWLFRNLTPEHVRELHRMGALYGYGANRLEGLLVLRQHRYFPNDLYISYIGGSRRATAAFRSFVLQTALERGSESIRGVATCDATREVLDRLGMKPHPRIGQVLVYDYPI